MRRLAVLPLLLTLLSCKTAGEEARTASPVTAPAPDAGTQPTPAPLTLREVADEPAEPPAFERRATDDTSELAGFDADGALDCLPLAAGTECLPRVDPLEAACKAVGGEVLRCEDCSLLCSRPLPSDGP